MSEDKSGTLLRIAEAITDGTPVDWRAEGEAPKDLGRRIGRLRLLEEVMAAHHRLPLRESLAETTTSESPAAGAATPPPSPSWGPLKVLEPLGQGGFADVYRAYDPSLQREVALKLLRADRPGAESNKFLKEARRLARLRHPNVLAVYGADSHDGRAGLWTELLRGATLEEVLAQHGPFGAQEAAVVGAELCRALSAVHGSGLVHGDVKTSNVLREQGGRIVLTDFGSVTERPAGSVEEDAEDASGTPLYMSPERLRGERSTPASDIYSLGVVLYRMVTGRFPVEARSLPELQRKQEVGERVPLADIRSDLPASFVQAVERALERNPASRYGSAGAMGSALVSTMALSGPSEPVAWTPAIRRRRTRRIAWAAAAALAVTVGVLLYRHLSPSPLNPEVRFYRVVGGEQQPLSPGSRLRPGDALIAEIEGLREMYVYALNEDDHGRVFVLFPVPGLEPANPLPPKVVHRLPGHRGGEAVSWQVTSVGGKETILVIASSEPLRSLEKEISGFPRALPGAAVAYGELSNETIGTLRGMGGLVTTEQAEGGRARLSEALVSLASQAGRGSPIWISRYEFENPGP